MAFFSLLLLLPPTCISPVPTLYPSLPPSPSLSVYLYISTLQVAVKPSWWFSQHSHIAEARPQFPSLFLPIFPSLELSQPTWNVPTWPPSFCSSMSAWAKLLCEIESKTLQSRLVGNLFALEPGLLIYPEISASRVIAF